MNRPIGPSLSAMAERHVSLPETSLDALLPMALRVSPTGEIRHLGPTLAKLTCLEGAEGVLFLDAFEVLRPRAVAHFHDVLAYSGGTLRLRTKTTPHTQFRGVGVPTAEGGLLVSLSFGLNAVTAVGEFSLTASDFSATDLTVEMLYLVEANRAVQGELRRYNRRLHWEVSEAEEQAFTDTLTGLKNRRALESAFKDLKAKPEVCSLVQLDLDHFKAVNDSFGHAAGDAVLIRVGQILLEETRNCDTIFRVGGDEFVLLIRGMDDVAALQAIGQRLLQGVAEPIMFEGHQLGVGASIGVAISTNYAEPDPDVMLRDADGALYDAKRRGRGCMAFAKA